VILGSSADAGVADADGVAVGGRIAGGAADRGIVPELDLTGAPLTGSFDHFG